MIGSRRKKDGEKLINVIDIYERVTLSSAVSQPVFIHYFNDSAMYLLSDYRSIYVLEDGIDEYTPAQSIHDTSPIRNIFGDCIVDNIIYLVTGNNDRRTDFVAKAEKAYNSVWADKARGAVCRRRHCHSYSGW